MLHAIACPGCAEGPLLHFLFCQALLQPSSMAVTAPSCGSITLLPTKRNNCGSKHLSFICPSWVERIRFLFLCLQVQINSLKPSGRRTPMTRLHFRSPHNCFGQGILNGLLSVGTQLTKRQNLFQKWLAQTLSISGIPCPRPQIPCPIAGPGPGINYWLFSRQQYMQLRSRSRSPSLESYPTSRERSMVFFSREIKAQVQYLLRFQQRNCKNL